MLFLCCCVRIPNFWAWQFFRIFRKFGLRMIDEADKGSHESKHTHRLSHAQRQRQHEMGGPADPERCAAQHHDEDRPDASEGSDDGLENMPEGSARTNPRAVRRPHRLRAHGLRALHRQHRRPLLERLVQTHAQGDGDHPSVRGLIRQEQPRRHPAQPRQAAPHARPASGSRARNERIQRDRARRDHLRGTGRRGCRQGGH